MEKEISMKVRVHPLRDSIPLPRFATEGSACFDLRADINFENRVEVCDFHRDGPSYYSAHIERHEGGWAGITMHPNRYYKIPTGLSFEIPQGFALRIYIRSSAAYGRGMRLINSVAIIDSDYRDEVFLLMACDKPYSKLTSGERIAQGEIYRLESFNFEYTPIALTRLHSRAGGIGSTGCE
jgi:dUTP pyrophosphatase